MTVEAAATDDVRVARVEFLLDGEVVHQDFSTPFRHTFRAPEGAPSLTLGARAVDLGENAGHAEDVVLTVIPDADPTVDFLSPNAGNRLSEGVSFPIVVEATDDVAITSVELLVDGISRQVLTGPLFRFDFTIPLGTRELTLDAVATDDVGQTAAAGPLVVGVEDDMPPVSAVIQPADATEVVAGSRLRVVMGAVDDRAVERVRLLVDGALAGEDFQAPYELEIDVPASAGTLTLRASAFDVPGQEGVAPELRLNVVPDPLTVVFGNVVTEDGSAVAGADLTCAGVGGQSDTEGIFSLPGVPTLAVEVSCTATFVDAQGVTLSGVSASVPPVPAGITDVGEITVVASRFIKDLGTLLNLFDDDFEAVALPFELPFFGQLYSTVFVNSNGSLTFDNGSTDWSQDAGELVSGRRNIGNFDVGPAIAVFWDDLSPDFDGVAGEIDVFRFSGSAGEAVIAEIFASREGSALDSVLTLFDSAGQEVGFNDDDSGSDSRIELDLPSSGNFFLELRDFARRGGPSFFYTLTLDSQGAPRLDVGDETEPNDTFASASPLAFGNLVRGTISTLIDPDAMNVFVNDQLPGRLVITWNNVPEFPDFGSNTFQVSLFADGRIEMIYAGMTSDDAIVGISPATGGEFLEVDLSVETPLSFAGSLALFEEFEGPGGPDGRTGSDRPFDLDGRSLRFVPNAGGGYDVILGGGDGGSSFSQPRGIVEGRVVTEEGTTASELEVVLTSSVESGYEARTVCEADGSFRLTDVPAGGINVRAYRKTEVVGQGSGVLTPEGTLRIKVRPLAGTSKEIP